MSISAGQGISRRHPRLCSGSSLRTHGSQRLRLPKCSGFYKAILRNNPSSFHSSGRSKLHFARMLASNFGDCRAGNLTARRAQLDCALTPCGFNVRSLHSLTASTTGKLPFPRPPSRSIPSPTEQIKILEVKRPQNFNICRARDRT